MQKSNSQNNRMRDLGELCSCCSSPTGMKTTEKKDPPRRLKRVGKAVTQNQKLMLVGCEHCDGPLLTLAARATED